MCKPIEGLTREGRRDIRGPEKVVRFGTYNIQSRRKWGLESALRGVDQGKFDCLVIHETNLKDGVYTRGPIGFQVMVIVVPIYHHGGVAVFYREAEHFTIEDIRIHGLNIISLQMVMGRRWWHIVEWYISPSNTSNIEDVVVSIRSWPNGAELLLARDLNANLEEPEVTLRLEAIGWELTADGLVDMAMHLLPRHKPWLKDRCIWRMHHDGQ